MMVNIIIALIVSMDSFFIALLTCESKSLGGVVLAASPVLHVGCCLLGLLIEQDISRFVSQGIAAVVGLVIILAGGCLVRMYKPQLQGQNKRWHIEKVSVRLMVILFLFCSLDALAAGYIYGFWKTPIAEGILCMGVVNLSVVLCAILAGRFLIISETKLTRGPKI